MVQRVNIMYIATKKKKKNATEHPQGFLEGNDEEGSKNPKSNFQNVPPPKRLEAVL